MTGPGLLLIDVGNSSVKWCFIDSAGEVGARGNAEADRLLPMLEFELAQISSGLRVFVSSVAAQASNQTLRMTLESLGCSVWFASARSELGGLRNSYADPSKMGVDRWLAMLAARALSTQRVCVIDAGSALTIDIVGHTGQHEGGYILPGKALMQNALLSNTDRVRFESEVPPQLVPGRSTAEAVSHGLLLAQCGTIALAVAEAQREEPLAQVFLTGGDAAEIAAALQPAAGVAVTLSTDLVLAGLVRQARLEGESGAEMEVALLKNSKLHTRMD
ncbi:MAG: type III pantothenate kinase [Congregibacter sp.]